MLANSTDPFSDQTSNLDEPFVSIIIPCHNEIGFIDSCLDSILNNNYNPNRLEIIIIDGMSNDGTRAVLKEYDKKYSQIRFLDNPKKEQQIALNIGIQNARGEYIMRMDAHTDYDKNYISECIKAFKIYGADNVGGRWVIVPRTNDLMGHTVCIAVSSPFGVGNATYRLKKLDKNEPASLKPIWDINVGYLCCRKEIFDKIGLFNENLNRSEDIDFLHRLKKAKYRTLYVPSIISYYKMRTTPSHFLKHMFKNGMWVLIPLNHESDISFSLRHIVPFLFVTGLIVTTLLSFWFLPALWLLLGIITSYSCLSFYFSFKLSKREKNWKYFFSLPPTFFLLHFSYGIGSLAGLGHLLFSKTLGRFFKRKHNVNVQPA